jgi:hypothetical protein
MPLPPGKNRAPSRHEVRRRLRYALNRTRLLGLPAAPIRNQPTLPRPSDRLILLRFDAHNQRGPP